MMEHRSQPHRPRNILDTLSALDRLNCKSPGRALLQTVPEPEPDSNSESEKPAKSKAKKTSTKPPTPKQIDGRLLAFEVTQEVLVLSSTMAPTTPKD
ncbi:hypothetical protein FLONG3_6890 [Fusarium longipes]|uniref:Uncharacterized protein n=1 Tax=Fusarium longipes TaxID=694270 RepID=A0A395SIT4_9HYPO|nr:hypothetical protein FLONG3_6890 [Fusarium longipes]